VHPVRPGDRVVLNSDGHLFPLTFPWDWNEQACTGTGTVLVEDTAFAARMAEIRGIEISRIARGFFISQCVGVGIDQSYHLTAIEFSPSGDSCAAEEVNFPDRERYPSAFVHARGKNRRVIGVLFEDGSVGFLPTGMTTPGIEKIAEGTGLPGPILSVRSASLRWRSGYSVFVRTEDGSFFFADLDASVDCVQWDPVDDYSSDWRIFTVENNDGHSFTWLNCEIDEYSSYTGLRTFVRIPTDFPIFDILSSPVQPSGRTTLAVVDAAGFLYLIEVSYLIFRSNAVRRGWPHVRLLHPAPINPEAPVLLAFS
jgi:hypothetical protein